MYISRSSAWSAIALVLLTACASGRSGSVAQPDGPLGLTPVAPTPSGPKITSVSRIKPEQYQKIVISGSGFGTMSPYNGDSAYIRFRDKTGKWDAGHTSSSEIDSVWLDVTEWSDSKIVITGFTNDYGQEGWVLNKGDRVEFYVWNPQDDNGPATKGEKVK
jgi:hypothetical protein